AAAAGVLDLGERAIHDGVERAVEILKQLDPVEMLFFDLIELQLHAGGEADVHYLGERLNQLRGDDRAEHRCEKAAIDLLDVLAILDRLNDARIGGRAAD